MRKTCESCGADGSFPDDRQGERVECSQCGASFLLPIVLQSAPQGGAATVEPARPSPEIVPAAVRRPKRSVFGAVIAALALVVVVLLAVNVWRRVAARGERAGAAQADPAEGVLSSDPAQSQPGSSAGSARSGTRVERGQWRVDNEGQLVQSDTRAGGARVLFGDPSWTDYEFSLKAKKTAGSEGFLVIVRASGPTHFYWANIGGWSNCEHGLEKANGGRQNPIAPKVSGSARTGQWYEVRVRVSGTCCQVWLDDKRIADYTDRRAPLEAGQVGVGTWNTAAVFRDFEVRAPDGELLWHGPPKM